MKKRLYGLLVCCVVSSFSSVRGCGSLGDFFASPAAQTVFTYVVIEGQEYFKSLVKTTIKSLITLQAQHPEIFDAYITYCLDGIQGSFSDKVINVLKQFNLIQSDASVSDAIKTIVSMAIEKLDNGDTKIWSLDELIKDNWVSVN